MAIISYDCPHEICGTKNSAFRTIVSHQSFKGIYGLFAICQSCGNGVVFHFKARGNMRAGVDLATMNSAELEANVFLAWVSPRPQTPDTLPDLPVDVANAFNEAEDNRTGKRWSSAAVMYRKAIERGLKHKFPEGKGMLNARIRDLEGKNALPHSLVELLDEVKFLGNDGAHDDDPTAADVAAGAEFTRLFLTYTFVLPAQIAAAQSARLARK